MRSVVWILLSYLPFLVWSDLVLSSKNKPSRRITPATWDATMVKFDSELQQYEKDRIKVENRNLVIFHVGDLGQFSNSLDIAMNNLKIFLGAVELHSRTAAYKAFYLFNVIDDYNPLLSLIPTSKPNVGLLKWTMANSDLDVHLRTLKILGRNITDRFGSVIFTNQGVRGPLVKRKDGEWLGEFQNLLHSNNVGLVGPTLSCEVSPHVQTYMFALQTKLIPEILSQMRQNMTTQFSSWPELIAALEVGLTGVVLRAGYNVSSFLYNNRGHPYFSSGKCLVYTGPPNRFDKNPTGWCGVTPEEMVFLKWGGEPMRTRGFICNTTVLRMENILEEMTINEPQMKLTVPEALMGGPMYPLLKEYAAEAWIDRHPIPASKALATSPKVCFLARVTNIKPDRMPHENPYSHLMNKDIELFVTTLRRQTNPNWLAFFFRIDLLPSEEELSRRLNAFADPRVEHWPIPGVAQYNTNDAGYAATDAALRRALGRPECQWISVTAADNSYGSEVVDRILRADGAGTKPNMIIAPLDSRRYLEQDMLYNKKFLVKEGKANIEATEYCGLLSNIEHNGFTYAIRPMPMLGKIDLASVFFQKDKLAQEQTYFSNFTDKIRYPCEFNVTDPINYKCLGNQGAQLVFHLVQRRLWTYTRLPIEGLKSVVIHGNSPTLCIGAGDVWIDTVWRGFVDPTMAMCITPKDALRIFPEIAFDMEHFFHQDIIVGNCFRARNPAPIVTPFFDPEK